MMKTTWGNKLKLKGFIRTTCIRVRRFHLLRTQSRKWKKSVISEFKDWCLWGERGSGAAAVCLHHLLSVQLAAESLINTPSRGESPIIPPHPHPITCRQPASAVSMITFPRLLISDNYEHVTFWTKRDKVSDSWNSLTEPHQRSCKRKWEI